MLNQQANLTSLCCINKQFDPETLAKIRILRSSGVGPVSYKRWMKRATSAQHIVSEWRHFAGEKPLCDMKLIDAELAALQRAGAFLILLGDSEYPVALRDLPDAPAILTGLGDPAHLQTRMLGIVGNRSASMAGITWTQNLATTLARQGLAICSGLARGIDTAAHTGCLHGGSPTIAVVAGGVDHIYPPENAKLRSEIIGHGCVISEQPWGTSPTATLFPRRNRLIAGLSLGILVSEATRHSGSLITAEFALNYGRDVWAVPGNPTDPRSGGPNWLLKQGATLVENAADILASLPATPAPYIPRVVAAQPDLFATPDVTPFCELVEAPDAEPLSPQACLFALLGHTPVTFDTLVRESALPEAVVSSSLIELELDGHATQDLDGRWRR